MCDELQRDGTEASVYMEAWPRLPPGRINENECIICSNWNHIHVLPNTRNSLSALSILFADKI
jgi:hypothetical protein